MYSLKCNVILKRVFLTLQSSWSINVFNEVISLICETSLMF